MAESLDPGCSSSTSTSSPVPSDSDSRRTATVSLLDRLRAPALSELSRKRKVHANPPTGKKRSLAQTAGKFDPHSVKPSQRASEFPGEDLVESAGKLFCKACRENVAVKRSVVVNHVKSKKHAESKERLQTKTARERDIATALQKHDSETHRKGETLPDPHKVYRVKVVMAFMKSGIPMSKLNCPDLRQLLEENGYSLTDTRHMLDMVPFVLGEERQRIRAELQGKYLSVVFDGTTRLGEVLAVVVRFMSEWSIEQRLVRLEFLLKSVTGEELARELISILSVTLGVESHMLLGVMHDRASVNSAAMRTVRVMYPHVLDIGCISHTLDLVGGKFKCPSLHLFFTLWISLFSHSPKVRALWKEETGRAMSSYSQTRWWSRWEVMHQVLQQFGDVEPFLSRHLDLGPATGSKLRDIIRDPQQLIALKMELAAVIDVGTYFVKGTYNLEGDGVLVVNCYEELLKIRAAVHTRYYPNVGAVARQASPSSSAHQRQLIDYALSCVQPGLQYFHEKFGNDSDHPVAAFKAARVFSPSKADELRPTAADIDSLSTFSFFSSSTISSLKEELPTYLAKASNVDPSMDILKWWKQHSPELPHWSAAARKMFLIQPSSAAAERVFSILNRSFDESQTNSLEDYVEASVMLQYNHPKC